MAAAQPQLQLTAASARPISALHLWARHSRSSVAWLCERSHWHGLGSAPGPCCGGGRWASHNPHLAPRATAERGAPRLIRSDRPPRPATLGLQRRAKLAAPVPLRHCLTERCSRPACQRPLRPATHTHGARWGNLCRPRPLRPRSNPPPLPPSRSARRRRRWRRRWRRWRGSLDWLGSSRARRQGVCGLLARARRA